MASDVEDKLKSDAISDDKLRDITGIDKAEENAIEARVAEGTDSDDTIGEGYKDKSSRRKTRFTTRQKAAGGGIAGLLIGGGFGIFTVVSGPLQIIHLSNLLSTKFFARNSESGDISARRIYNYLSGNPERNNLSALGSQLAKKNRADLLAKGIDLNFETPAGKNRSKIQSLKVNTDTPDGRKFLSSITEGLDAVDISGNIATIDLRGKEGTALARQAIDEMVEVSGKKKISGLLMKRRLRKLMGVRLHPLTKAKSKVEDINDFIKERRAARAKEASKGAETKSTGKAVGSEPDANGKTTGPDAGTDVDAGKISSEVDDIAKIDDPFEKRISIKGIGGKLLKIGGTAAAVAAVLCSVRDIGDQIPKYQMTNVIKPLARLAMQYISAGSQVQAMQDISMDDVASLSQALYDNETKTSWASATPIKALSGESGGTDIDSNAKAQITNAYNAKKPLLFEFIENIPGLSGVCKANDFLGNIPGLKQLNDVTSKLISGASSAITGKSLEDWMGDLVGWLAGGAVDTLAEGSNLGNLLAYGSVLSSNTSAITSGGSRLSNEQVVAWNNYLQKNFIEEQKHKSMYARLFNIKDSNSLISSIAIKSSEIKFENISPQKFIASIIDNLGNVLSPQARAAKVNGYDYGIPFFGIPLSTLNNSKYEDPYENIDSMEDNNYARLKELNQKFKGCFGDMLSDTGDIVDREIENFKEVEGCADKFQNDPDFQDYQMYLLDNATIRSLTCFEGLDESECSKLGFGGSSNTPSTGMPIKGLTSHPNLGGPVQNNYYLLPDAPNNEYQWDGGTPPERRYGSKALVDAIYTVAIRWYQKYPNNKLIIGDLNAREGHKSHMKGVDVDISTVGSAAANTAGNREMSKELGRMFADTGIIKVIFYNDQQVQADFNQYTKDQGLSGSMTYEKGHENHFHVRILDEYMLLQGGQP